jgi:hypothetical protein
VAFDRRYAFFEGVVPSTNAGADQRDRLDDDAVLWRDNLDENGGGIQSVKRRPVAK